MALAELTNTMTSTSQYTIRPMRSFSASMRRETDSRKFIFPPQWRAIVPYCPSVWQRRSGGVDASRGTGKITHSRVLRPRRHRMDFLLEAEYDQKRPASAIGPPP